MNTVGLLVRTSGEVMSVGTGEFYMTDGSGDPIRIDSSAASTQPVIGDYACVTGICRLEKTGELYSAFIELRDQSDWLVVP